MTLLKTVAVAFAGIRNRTRGDVPGKPARRFFRDTGGGAMIMLAGSMIPAIGFAGIAVDGSIAYLADDRLQSAVDAAALSTGASIDGTDQSQEARQMVELNFQDGYLGAEVDYVSLEISADLTRVTLAAGATVPTYFMGLLGHNSLSVNARAVVERSIPSAEIVLVMDNTGSMRSGGKIDAMKDAALDLIGIIKPEGSSNEELWVGLVPYTATVNIGPQHAGWIRSSDPLHSLADPFPGTTWKGCVEARRAPHDELDTHPDAEPFASYLYRSNVDNVWLPPTGYINERNSAQNRGRGPNLGCGPAITFLTTDRPTIEAAIREMLPWHRCGTLGNLGLVWGWRMLSPTWRGLWNNDAASTTPVDYGDPAIQKIAIVMTDGQNQLYDWRGHDENDGIGPEGSDFSAYGRLHRFGYTSLRAARHEVDRRFTRTCENMKRAGITLYTMTFGGTPDSDTRSLYEDCASVLENYFHAPANDDLVNAFRTIGTRLVTQRLVE